MRAENVQLSRLFEGWDTYQISLVDAVEPLSRENLVWKANPNLRSAGEIAAHISEGRIDWFNRMGAPWSVQLIEQLKGYGSLDSIAEDAKELVKWLKLSWGMVKSNLDAWTTSDLWETYQHPYQGAVYAVSRQWTIWRVVAHDLHHGGELAVMLGLQGIPVPELGDLGGHLNMPPLAEA